MIIKLLAPRELRLMTQVSRRLFDIACPIYLVDLGLDISSRDYLSLSDEAYGGLSVWRRSTHYHPLTILFCWFSFTPSKAVQQVAQLENFFSTHPSVQSIQITYSSIQISVIIVKLLGSIQLTECRQVRFHYLGHDHCPTSLFKVHPFPVAPVAVVLGQLESFCTEGCVLFAPAFINSTINIILSSPIEKLSLANTGLNFQQWARLLPKLHIPTLQSLAIDSEVSVVTLSKFLSRHTGLRQLDILPCERSSFHPCKMLFQLPELRHLYGPALYLDALLRSFKLPSSLRYLGITSSPLGSDIYRAAVGRILCSASTCELFRIAVEIPGDVMNYSPFIDGMRLSQVSYLSIKCLVPTSGNFAVCCPQRPAPCRCLDESLTFRH
jgi:hypothetical protein